MYSKKVSPAARYSNCIIRPVVLLPSQMVHWHRKVLYPAQIPFIPNPIPLTAPRSVPNGYPNPTRYPVFFSIPDPTRFSFENHRVAGNPKYRVLPDISGKPEVSGITRCFGYSQTWLDLPDSDLDLQIICELLQCSKKTLMFRSPPPKKRENIRYTQKYPEIPRNTRKYPTVKKIPENTRSYISTLLPDPNPTRYPVSFLIPDPILKNPTRWVLGGVKYTAPYGANE